MKELIVATIVGVLIAWATLTFVPPALHWYNNPPEPLDSAFGVVLSPECHRFRRWPIPSAVLPRDRPLVMPPVTNFRPNAGVLVTDLRCQCSDDEHCTRGDGPHANLGEARYPRWNGTRWVRTYRAEYPYALLPQ